MSRRTLTDTPLLDVLSKHLETASDSTMCSFGYWLEKQDEKTREAFSRLSEAKNIAVQKLYNDLTEAGIDMPCKLTTFRMHMKGYCTCQKS